MGKRNETCLLLEGLRVLDLTDEKGLLCGKVLGDLGADVIKVEKPGGDAVRKLGPFYHDIPHPERSLFWLAFNNNKRGITLNIETIDGQAIFKKLVGKSDFVIESFMPGFMDKLGLGYRVLGEIEPRIIMASITPFGQTGPYKDFKASELVIMGMGGFLFLNGDADRAPVSFSFPQAFLLAGAEAASACMIAYYDREITGKGQYIDVSAQEGSVPLMTDAAASWALNKWNVTRQGSLRIRPSGAYLRLTWPCKDGYVSLILVGGKAGAQIFAGLNAWMDSEGMGDTYLKEMDAEAFDWSLASPEVVNRLQEPIAKFFMTHTKAEIYTVALEKKIMIYPVNSSKDIWDDPQLRARHFWQEIEHPELGTKISYPIFGQMSETPIAICRRAPLIGEHNREIYEGELGLSAQEMVLLEEANVI